MSSVNIEYASRGKWSMSDTGIVASGRIGTAPYGGSVSITDTGTADALYRNEFSIAASGTLLLDMLGGGGEEDVTRGPLDFARLVWVMLEITAPAASKKLRFGPASASNAWVGLWGDASDYNLVTRRFEDEDQFANWSVIDATHKILRIHNPGAATVAGVLMVAGLKN